MSNCRTEQGWTAITLYTVLWGSSVRISAGIPTVLSSVFSPHFIQTNTRIVPQLSHDRVLSNTFQLFIKQLSYYSTLPIHRAIKQQTENLTLPFNSAWLLLEELEKYIQHEVDGSVSQLSFSDKTQYSELTELFVISVSEIMSRSSRLSASASCIHVTVGNFRLFIFINSTVSCQGNLLIFFLYLIQTIFMIMHL
jgi:hypothetical protein